LAQSPEVGSEDKIAYQAVDALRWGFNLYTVHHDPKLFKGIGFSIFVEDYNQMQREQGIEEVVLDPLQSKTLAWMLDRVRIPHSLQETENHISLAPLEEQLQEASALYARKHPVQISRDHERSINIHDQMQEWQKQQSENNQEEQ